MAASLDKLADEQLASRAARGDTASLGVVLQRHHQRLYNVVLRMVSDREDAAELTQDAMVRIIEHIRDYNGGCQLTTWMIRIAMNLSISHLRKRRLRRHASLDAAYASGSDDGRERSMRDQLEDQRNPGPDQRVQEREMMTRMLQALDELEEEFRAVIVLRDINGMHYQEMAQVLDAPVGTIKSRLFRARLALRNRLSETETSSTAPGAGTASRRDAASSAHTASGAEAQDG